MRTQALPPHLVKINSLGTSLLPQLIPPRVELKLKKNLLRYHRPNSSFLFFFLFCNSRINLCDLSTSARLLKPRKFPFIFIPEDQGFRPAAANLLLFRLPLLPSYSAAGQGKGFLLFSLVSIQWFQLLLEFFCFFFFDKVD